MARATAATENYAIAGVFAAAQPTVSTTAYWASLHTADPSTTGASEYAGVTRLQYPAGSPSAGALSNTSTLTFTTSGATPVLGCGIYDAVTAGNYRIGALLSSNVTAVTITFAVAAMSYSAS